MPHSPRMANGALWVLDSGRGYLCRVDEASGAIERIAFCPGFIRGLAFWRHFALVATSLPRDSSFQGLELEDNLKTRDGEARCGAFIVDTRNGDLLHWIRFEGTVRELFDTAFLPGVCAPMCIGVAAHTDNARGRRAFARACAGERGYCMIRLVVVLLFVACPA